MDGLRNALVAFVFPLFTANPANFEIGKQNQLTTQNAYHDMIV